MSRFHLLVALSAVLLLANQCLGHICIIEPRQRGPLSIVSPGDDSCYRRTSYCGGIPAGAPTQYYAAGSTTNILFQQNLNHWYPPNPGYFDIAISSSPSEDNWQVLATFSDFAAHDMVVQTNFSIPVTMPNINCPNCVLRLRYVSNNPLEVDPANNTQAIFYNCADISIISNTEGEPSNVPSNSPSLQQAKASKTVFKGSTTKNQLPADFSCCTPPQWEGFAVENNKLGQVLHHVWYDQAINMTRWDRKGALPSGDDTSLSLITNYTSNVEYVIYPGSQQCFDYGPDAFYNWCFGSPAGQTYVGSFVMDGVIVAQFTDANHYFLWSAAVNDDSSCSPYSTVHGDSEILFYQIIPSIDDPTVFTPPSICKHSVHLRG